jgi:hypothetical protein
LETQRTVRVIGASNKHNKIIESKFCEGGYRILHDKGETATLGVIGTPHTPIRIVVLCNFIFVL